MKKLLMILGAVGLTVTTGTLVVSCTNSVERFDKLDFSDKNIYNTMILKMRDNNMISYSQANMFFDISSEEQITDVMKLINKSITDMEYKTNDDGISKNLKIKFDEKEYSDRILDNLAVSYLFNDYTTKMIANYGKSIGDETYANDANGWGRKLNPSNLVEDDSEFKYAVYFKENDQWERWQYFNEFKDDIKTHTPSLELLNSGDASFKVVATKDNKKVTNIDKLAKVSLNGTIGAGYNSFVIKEDFNSFEIMKYRFQNYINAKVKVNLYDQLIGMSYMNSTSFATNWTSRNYTNTNIRLNTNNKLVNSVQNKLTDNQESNVKMVWSIQNRVSSAATIQWISDIKTKLGNNATNNGNIIIGENQLKLLQELGTANNPANTVEQGSDNFFGIKGYNGLVRNTDSGVEAISTSSLAISTEAQTLIKDVTSPTILTNNGNGFSVSEGQASEIVVVLPIYLNDLYSAHNINIINNEMTIPKNTWIPLGDKVFNYETIDGSKVSSNDKNVSIVTDRTNNAYVKVTGNSPTAKININNKQVTINVSEQQSTLGITGKVDQEDKGFLSSFDTENQAKFTEDDQIIYAVNLSRSIDPLVNFTQLTTWENNKNQSSDVRNLSAVQKQNLLDQMQNGLVAKDADFVEEAKTILYTKYIIDGDNVLYQGLYDQISKYIKDDGTDGSD